MIQVRNVANRGYRAEAKRRWGAKNIIAIDCEGPWALVSLCPDWIKISLWPTEAEAIREKRIVDICCGHDCWGTHRHIIVDLRRNDGWSASPTPSQPAGARS